MAKIQIEGIGVVEVSDDFKTASPEDQQKVVDMIKEQHASKAPAGPTTGEKVTDQAVDFVKDTAGDVVETAGDIVIDTTAALPDALLNLADGRLDKIVFKLGGIILGNVGELVITVGANGLYTIGTISGTTLIDGLKDVDLKKMFNALNNSAVISTLKNANLDSFKERLKYATGIDTDKVESNVKGNLLDKFKDTWEKIASAPGTATLGFVNELTFGALVGGLDLAGYDATGYLEKNPEVAKEGKNLGFIVSLAGGPALAAKMLGTAAKKIVQGAFRGHAKRTNVGKLLTDEKALNKILTETKNLKNLNAGSRQVLDATRKAVNKDLRDIDSMLKTLRSKRTEYGDSSQDIRKWWNEAVGEKPSNSILKKYPDIFESVFDRLLAQSQKGRASSKYVDDLFLNPLKDNARILIRNWPSGLVEAAGLLTGDLLANYGLAYRNAIQNGAADAEARDIAFAFMLEKTPRDLALDVISKLTKGTVLALAPTAGRLYIAASRTEDGQIIDPRTDQSVAIEAGRGGPDRSPKGTGGDYGVPKQFNRGGYIKRKGIMRY